MLEPVVGWVDCSGAPGGSWKCEDFHFLSLSGTGIWIIGSGGFRGIRARFELELTDDCGGNNNSRTNSISKMFGLVYMNSPPKGLTFVVIIYTANISYILQFFDFSLRRLLIIDPRETAM